ncbi:MAG: metallophosphoesterase family protein [Deltaproteobacteria bacterium]|nr:metallophosphoesterase family protein [Deltaproteobacteria bacterium]
MRLAFFSDVHGNLEALEIFLEALRNYSVDRLFCLGDSVGYGPNPNECLELIRSIDNVVVLMGNHEWALLHMAMAERSMSPVAFKAIDWTRLRLTDANFEYISGLPMGAEYDSFCFFHASAHSPQQWDYVRPGDRLAIELCFSSSSQRITCVGHTHRPMLIDANGDQILPTTLFSDGINYQEDGKSNLIINPGSIGQPRDRSHLPCYVIYDSENHSITWRHLSNYDASITAKKILNSNLPWELAYHLIG